MLNLKSLMTSCTNYKKIKLVNEKDIYLFLVKKFNAILVKYSHGCGKVFWENPSCRWRYRTVLVIFRETGIGNPLVHDVRKCLRRSSRSEKKTVYCKLAVQKQKVQMHYLDTIS